MTGQKGGFMDDLISRQALCEYALNQKDKSITPNDIMRFPSAQPDSKETSYTHKALDTISRQAAIRWVKTECNPYGKPTLDFESGKKVIEHLKQMPSAQPTEASCWGCNCPKMERLKEQKTFSEMVHLHDAETHEERTETHECDLISRQEAIEAHYEYCNKHPDAGFPVWSLKILEELPSAQPDLPEWVQKVEEYRKIAPKTFSSPLAWALYQVWKEYAG